MVIKNRLSLSILIATLFIGALPVVAAQQLPMPKELELPMPEQNGKDEKVEKAEKEDKEKEAAEAEKKILRGLEKRIPFEIPDRLKLKDKNGKIKEEFLESMKEDVLSLEPFATIINNQLDQNKHALIARDHKPSGKELAHYFDTEQLHRAFETFQGDLNPTNKQQVNLSYFVYAPELKCFIHVSDAPSEGYIGASILQELATLALGRKYQYYPELLARSREMLTHLTAHATAQKIKNYALVDLANLYLSIEGECGGKKAYDLLLSIVDASGRTLVDVHTLLAIGYFKGCGEWQQDTDRAFEHVLLAINDPNINLVEQYMRISAYCIAGELLIKYHDNLLPLGFKPQSHHALSLLEQGLEWAEKIDYSNAKVRAHACLAICYYNDPIFGEGRYTEGDGGRYVKAWDHCMKALQKYDVVKNVKGFLDVVAATATQCLNLDNGEGVNKVLADFEQLKKSNHDKKLNDALQAIINTKTGKKDSALVQVLPAGLLLDANLDAQAHGGEHKERDSKKRKAKDQLAGSPAAKKGSGAGSGSGSRSAAELDKD